MGRGEQRTKDQAMAANLLNSAFHNGNAVAARKARRLRETLARLAGGNYGSAAYRRRISR